MSRRYRISCDVGGTFTDVVVADETGALTLGKALTTRQRMVDGLSAALASAAEPLGTDVPTLLGAADLLIYGTTRATNAILEGRTARTALLVTEGFPDILVRREGGKLNPFDFDEAYPPPYVPRRLTVEIRERVDAQGDVVVPLDVDAARAALRELAGQGVEAVGVCLLWSIRNGAHEATLGELIAEELPGVPFTLSHRLNPTMREYRRASSTVIDASLKPLMQDHLRVMAQDLRAAGFRGELLAAVSVGGVMHVEDVVERPILLVRSGPSLAPVAGRAYAAAEQVDGPVIVCDTGGTSFDVSLVRGGELVSTRETWLGPRYTGHLTGLSSVDVNSIGAGGGSIAWQDDGGLLRVGPHSAGSEPGPAAYGRGGTLPTVTDAATVLGYLDPGYFLGGRLALDVGAARRAVETIADGLGVPVERAAAAILAIADEQMIAAIKEITVNEGLDPRESLLIAGGGAAGLNIVPIAAGLGCRRVLVPRTAGALSACGAQFSDVVAEFAVTEFTTTGEFASGAVNAALDRIDAEIETFAAGLRGRGLSRISTSYSVEARYPYQVWDLPIPLPAARFATDGDVAALREAFHQAHERVFAVREAEQEVECVNWRGRVTVALERPPIAAGGDPPRTSAVATRRLYFGAAGWVDAAILRGGELGGGAEIVGPAVIQEATTTIVLYPGSRARLTRHGSYLIELDTEVPA